MKKLATLIIAGAAVLGVGAAMLSPAPAYADCSGVKGAGNIAACSACEAEDGSTWNTADNTCDSQSKDLNTTTRNVITIMLFVIGILALIMVVYSGIRYVISRGNPEEVKNAKNTLLYSIVGLVIAILAFAIVQWVFNSLK